MKDYVGYHNAEKMGYSLREAREPFAFFTKKAAKHLLGSRVWTINGEGSPRAYSCAGWFVVEKIEAPVDGGLMHKAQGTIGHVFEPMICLNERTWFPRFLRSQSNFSLGLQAIGAEFVPEFEALAKPTNASTAPDRRRNRGGSVRVDVGLGGARSANIKCMSIKDPWITMIGEGRKWYELRKRKSHYRGPLVLCSSLARSKTRDAAKWPQHDGPKGKALYIVDMVGCTPATVEHAEGAGCAPVKGEWAWEFRNVRRLSSPVPMKGVLSFYPPTPALLKQLRKDRLIA